jgi:hypothetical protein
MSILFRKHRGSLAEAMETVIEVNSIEDIYNNSDLPECGIDCEGIKLEPYTYDSRIGWDTYAVIKKGHGIIGFTNGDFERKEIG